MLFSSLSYLNQQFAYIKSCRIQPLYQIKLGIHPLAHNVFCKSSCYYSFHNHIGNNIIVSLMFRNGFYLKTLFLDLSDLSELSDVVD